MVPTLACFLLGAAVSGPLVDWAAGAGLARVARCRPSSLRELGRPRRHRFGAFTRQRPLCFLPCLSTRRAWRLQAPSQAAGTHAIVPFALVLSLDRVLTLASTSLTEVAQNSLTSAALRGRIAGTYALLVILGLLLAAGVLQAAVLGLLAAAGRRRLWNYGLRAAK